MHPDCTPMVIGISGGSASGKTTFSEALAQSLDGIGPVILNQDRYFRDWEDYPPEEREAVRTANHPRAVLWPVLIEQIERLLARQSIQEPVPGTRARRQGVPLRLVEPADLVIVEGHLIFGNESLRDLMHLKIFLDVDPHERVLRRLLRDTQKGRTDLEAAAAWYRRDVLPNFPVYTESTRQYADLIVPFDTFNARAVELVAAGIKATLASRMDQDGEGAASSCGG